MPDYANISEFYKRWNIQIDEKQTFQELLNRISNVFSVIPDDTWKVWYSYIMAQFQGWNHEDSLYPSKIQSKIMQFKTIDEVIRFAQSFLWTQEKLYKSSDDTRETSEMDKILSCGREIVYRLRQAFDLSGNFNIAIYIGDEGLFKLIPCGAQKLDCEVVNTALHWLGDYPEIQKRFANALELCVESDPTKIRNLLDDLRFCVEQLIRVILNNKKSLENQKSELGRWLEKQGVDDHVRNMYSMLLFGQYTLFHNDGVKHDEKQIYSKSEIEFMIYLTGTFIRFVMQLNRAKNQKEP